MPTTTTAPGAGLAPMLDLHAPPAAVATGGKAGDAFGSLLQPPTDKPAPPEAREGPGWSGRPLERELSSSSRRRSEVEPGGDASTRDDAESGSHEAQAVETAEDACETGASDEAAADSEADCVVESLAGMPGCALPVPGEPQFSGGEPAGASEAAPTFGSRGRQPPRLPGAEPAVAHAVRSADQVGQEAAEAVSAPQSAEATDPALLGGEGNAGAAGGQADAPHGVAQTMMGGEADSIKDGKDDANFRGDFHEALLEASAEQGESPEAPSFGEELELTAGAASRPADAPLTTTAAFSVPAVAPLAALQVAEQMTAAAGDASASKSAVTAAGTALDSPGQTRRSGRRGEALVRDTGSAARSAGPDIDAPRLLNRVARAFAAAQQRDGDIQLRLSPPELGSLKLTVRMQDGGLVARLETETSSAKTAILDNLPALRERLTEQGLRIERFEVDLMQRQPGGMPDRSSDQERRAPPPSHLAPVLRPRGESPPPLSTAGVGHSPSGLNVIV